MGMIRKKYHIYTAWDYMLEIEDMNRESMAGWQLVKGGSICNTYEYDNTKRYRYQLDYKTKENGDSLRYLDTFKEQGWEYVSSTFNGWKYFRKEYHPELDESEYEIYTDLSQIPERNKKWSRIATIIIAFLSLILFTMVVGMILHPKILSIPYILLYSIITLNLFLGVKKMNGNPRKSNAISAISSKVLWPAIIIAIIMHFLLVGNGVNSSVVAVGFEVGNQSNVKLNTFEVKYPDFHYLDVKVKSDQEVEFIIQNFDGEEVFATSSNIEIKDKRLWLKRDIYSIYLKIDGEPTNTDDLSISYNIR